MTLRRKHVLDLDDFTADEIGAVLDTAEAMSDVLARPIKRVPALRGTTIVNCFYESSTRTRVSFELAAKNLSADVVNVTASGSSVDKGESLVDTSRTLQALGADMVVIRHRSSGAPYLVSQHIAARVINAGDGWHAHPTQALLDLFTVRRHLGDLAGLKLVIVGDILHSRVARSNLWGFTRMGADVTLCGPPTLVPHDLVAAVTGQPERQPHRARATPAAGHNGIGANGRAGQPSNRPVSDHAAATADAGQPATVVATAVRTAPQAATTGEPRGQVHITYDLDEALADADVVMALRLQKERQSAGAAAYAARVQPALRSHHRPPQDGQTPCVSHAPGTDERGGRDHARGRAGPAVGHRGAGPERPRGADGAPVPAGRGTRRSGRVSTALRPVLIRGGRVIDPAQSLDQVGDVLLRDGLVAAIGPNLNADEGRGHRGHRADRLSGLH